MVCLLVDAAIAVADFAFVVGYDSSVDCCLAETNPLRRDKSGYCLFCGCGCGSCGCGSCGCGCCGCCDCFRAAVDVAVVPSILPITAFLSLLLIVIIVVVMVIEVTMISKHECQGEYIVT